MNLLDDDPGVDEGKKHKHNPGDRCDSCNYGNSDDLKNDTEVFESDNPKQNGRISQVSSQQQYGGEGDQETGNHQKQFEKNANDLMAFSSHSFNKKDNFGQMVGDMKVVGDIEMEDILEDMEHSKNKNENEVNGKHNKNDRQPNHGTFGDDNDVIGNISSTIGNLEKQKDRRSTLEEERRKQLEEHQNITRRTRTLQLKNKDLNHVVILKVKYIN